MIHLPISNIYLFICSFGPWSDVHLLVVHLSTCVCVRSYCCSFIFCTFAILFFVCFCTFEYLISCQSVHFFSFYVSYKFFLPIFPQFLSSSHPGQGFISKQAKTLSETSIIRFKRTGEQTRVKNESRRLELKPIIRQKLTGWSPWKDPCQANS